VKTCTVCGQRKPHDPNPALKSHKASGFKGGKCWACYLRTNARFNTKHMRKVRADARALIDYRSM
jgi:hypothetical protein